MNKSWPPCTAFPASLVLNRCARGSFCAVSRSWGPRCLASTSHATVVEPLHLFKVASCGRTPAALRGRCASCSSLGSLPSSLAWRTGQHSRPCCTWLPWEGLVNKNPSAFADFFKSCRGLHSRHWSRGPRHGLDYQLNVGGVMAQQETKSTVTGKSPTDKVRHP